ncbi:MAG TPA: type I restriction enzyme endonuclease domain-containing protein [Candidatus Angelobacter sp.]|nr:type I restriction enzyme endonuclease domain-containing protein [Candidatus Angelobacter sp.]
MLTIVRRILRQHGYPPEKQEQATSTVIAQAELLVKIGLHRGGDTRRRCLAVAGSCRA